MRSKRELGAQKLSNTVAGRTDCSAKQAVTNAAWENACRIEMIENLSRMDTFVPSASGRGSALGASFAQNDNGNHQLNGQAHQRGQRSRGFIESQRVA